MRENRLEGTPVRYYTEYAEDKEWAVFLHAAFADSRMFEKQFGYFKGKYSVLALDIIGHGKSLGAKKGDGIEKTSEWINKIFELNSIEKAHFVGISLGAVLVQDFANRYPQKVLSLSCFGGYNVNNFDKRFSRGNSKGQICMMFKALLSVRLFAKANKKISAYTPEGREEFYKLNLSFKKSSFRFLAKLGKLVNRFPVTQRNYPLLIGCGEYDVADELLILDEWEKQEPCVKIVFENAGHCVNLDCPEQFNSALENFWNGASEV